MIFNPWDSYKNTLLEGDEFIHLKNGIICDGSVQNNLYKYKTISTIFENTYKHNNDISNISFPVLHYMMPNLIAFDIVGVQALENDTDVIFNLMVSKDVSDRLSINISKNTVTGEEKSHYKIDENSRNNDDLIRDIADNMRYEIDQKLINKLMDISGDNDLKYDQGKIAGASPSVFVGDLHAALAILINRQANRIAIKSRRGSGNWCVVSPTALTILQSSSIDSFTLSTRLGHGSGISHVGKLNNFIDVYCNQYADDDTPVLVGYKGNDMDSGLFYCPQLPFYVENNMVKSKYAFTELGGELNCKAKDYYGKIDIETSTLRFF